MRKAHTAWGKYCRDLIALAKQSQANPNTSGCKFQIDIANAMEEGMMMDKVIMEMEMQFITDGVLPDSDIKKGAEIATGLMSNIKDTSKKAAALKGWFKV